MLCSRAEQWLEALVKQGEAGTCAFLSRSMVRASQSGQQVSSSRVMSAKASMDPLSCKHTTQVLISDRPLCWSQRLQDDC